MLTKQIIKTSYLLRNLPLKICLNNKNNKLNISSIVMWRAITYKLCMST